MKYTSVLGCLLFVSGVESHDICPHPLLKEAAVDLPDASDWMANVPGDLFLNQVTLPGTHASGAYYLTKQFNTQTPLYAIAQKAPYSEGIIKGVACNFAFTQRKTIQEQLNAGIRVFEFRVDYDDLTDSFRTHHMFFGHEIYPLLKTIRAFLDEHSTEIVLIEIINMENPSIPAEKIQQFRDEILQIFSGILYPKVTEFNDTIDEMRRKNLRAILAVQDQRVRGDDKHELIWRTASIRDIHLTTSNIDEMKTHMDSKMTQVHDAHFHKMAWILLPVTKWILLHALSGKAFYHLATSVNSHLPEFVEKNSPLRGKIIMVDYFESGELMDTIRSIYPSSVELNYQ